MVIDPDVILKISPAPYLTWVRVSVVIQKCLICPSEIAKLQHSKNCSSIVEQGGGNRRDRVYTPRCFLLWCCSSLCSPNLLPEPPRPLPYLEDMTEVLRSVGPSTHSVLTSPSGTKLTVSPGSSALIGKSSAWGFLDFKVFRVYITVMHLVNHYIKDLVIQTWALRHQTNNSLRVTVTAKYLLDLRIFIFF